MRVYGLVLGLVITSACATSSSVAPSPGPFRFSGTISAVEGTRVAGPIPGAQLTVIDGVNTDAHVTSDAEGRYVFPSLEKGRFTVTIAAPGFVSVTPVVDLYGDTEVHFALKRQ